MPAQTAPHERRDAAPGRCAGAGSCPANEEPTQTRRSRPTMYWPWPPMLNRPQRNANATASPVRMSVVVRISVCCRLNAASCARAPLTHGNSQLRPAPLKIALYVASGLLPGGRRARPGRRRGTRGAAVRTRREEAAGLRRDVVALEPAAAAPPGRGPTDPAPRRRLVEVAHAAACLRAAAGHRDPELLLGRVRRELADDLALVDHEDPVGEREHLLELERHEQHRAALVALLDEAPVDVLDRADVEAARRLGGDQHPRVAGDLAGERRPSAGCRPRAPPARVAARRRGRRTR